LGACESGMAVEDFLGSSLVGDEPVVHMYSGFGDHANSSSETHFQKMMSPLLPAAFSTLPRINPKNDIMLIIRDALVHCELGPVWFRSDAGW
jgi:hypothetical protein